MSESAPIRPQRIIRANRETTGGLLMSVIRSLTSSRDSADRDRERLELEKGFQQCDVKLDEMITEHSNDLYQVMANFSKILNNLSRAKERLIDTRDKLLSCQKLLHCKRDELKKLWFEIVENRAVFNLLERIEQISLLPRQVDSYAEKKHYLHAAQCCIDGLSQLGNNFSSNQERIRSPCPISIEHCNSLGKIDALSEIRVELLAKKEMLFDKCIDELHRHLYQSATDNIRKTFQEQYQSRLAKTDVEINQISSVIYDLSKGQYDGFKKDDLPSFIARYSSANGIAGKSIDNLQFDAYPEEDSRQFIGMLTKCIGLLNKISDANKIIKERFDEEFVNLVIRTAQDVLSQNASMTGNDFLPTSNQQVQLSTSFIDLNKSVNESASLNYLSQDESQTSNGQQDPVVLTCTRLLGYRYNAFSHLKRKEGIENPKLPRTSLQLKQLFDLLMKQFFYIIQLHESIVLFNLKHIESSFNLTNVNDIADTNDTENEDKKYDNDDDDDNDNVDDDNYNAKGERKSKGSNQNCLTMFYESADIWNKIQLLVQQLLDYYLDISQISGQASSSVNSVINYNLVSSILQSAAANMLFGNSNNIVNSTISNTSSSNGENYSMFFLKRRPLVVAGAMNAMNVMMTTGKNTLNSTSASNQQTNTDVSNSEPIYSSPTAGNSVSGVSATGALKNHTPSSNNLIQTFSNSAIASWRPSQANLFKFDHSTQAISWNNFLQQQQRQKELNMDDCCNNNELEPDDINFTSNTGNVHSCQGNINARLFGSLQAICPQSPDNLVLIYDNLLQHLQKLPFNVNQTPITMVNEQENHSEQILYTLQTYLLSSSEKFTQHISSQLDAMLEQAQKSLEAGVTIMLTDNNESMENNRLITSIDESISDTTPTYERTEDFNKVRSLVLLESTVLVDVAVWDLSILMSAMNDYRQHYLGYICNVLTSYKDICTRMYDTVTMGMNTNTATASGAQFGQDSSSLDVSQTVNQNASERRSILSAFWAHNEDINRLLKSQPNWIRLQIGAVKEPVPQTESKIVRTLPKRINRQMSSFDESPEDVRQRNASEIDILMNLLFQEIARNEVIWSDEQIALLANMQQSFEWLSIRCDNLAQLIQNSNRNYNEQERNEESGTDPSGVYIATLNQLSRDFLEIAQHCLLVLHLEIRVHCCYHLHALDAQFFSTSVPISTANNVAEPSSVPGRNSDSDDSRIMPLLDDLQRIYNQVSTAQLSTAKMNYLFEGLDLLMATVMINLAMSMRRVKPNGIKRACRAIYDIQRRLSIITKSRELALDYARQYFEMLLLTPDEILFGIIERGKQFKPQEYVAAITLLHQSGLNQVESAQDNGQHKRQLTKLLNRLNEILNEVSA